ncbi:hypothetical protein BDR04DRAFT_1126829 [Suillus decipiens]|nr:hypothetical protein BDR04DRAFT_1126829 [Suillus decipiens]
MASPGLQSHHNNTNPEDQEPSPQLDDIKVDYHPHSQIPSTIHHFAEFSHTCPTGASVTEISLEAALTAEQKNRLLSLIHCSAFQELWSTASQCFTPFQVDIVSVPYKNKVHKFDMPYHPLLEWALDMLQDQCLVPHFVFDAQCLYKFNDTHFVCFIDEPWTADAFWDAQAKPLAFILYADKEKPSSFSTQKAYLIICWIANLPVEIWNGTGIGGSRIVGWLPIVSEDSEHAGKSSFVNFKNAIWHESFLKLLEFVIQISRTGCWFECSDAIKCLIWPLILILSTDYEEQFPCLICLVPQDEQSFLSHELQLWISAESEETLQLACMKKSKKEREKLLKTYSLHDVEVCYDALPWWSNLMHFLKVVGVDFNDSSHHEDISKMAIFVAQRILFCSQSKLSYLLLQCICHYIDRDIYAGFEVHTEDSIVAGRQALWEFSVLMDISKDWNFPKKHTSLHLFDNILAKDIYHNQMNFKDIATQILRYDHWLLTLTSMHSELNELDKYNRKANLPTAEDADAENPAISVAPAPCTHVKLGSVQGDISFASLEQLHTDDRAFVGFRIKLNSFLNTFFPSNNIPLPDGKHIHLQADNKITGCKYLQVNYKSMSSPKFISVRLIIQGTALASNPGRQGDYFVINMVDADMFLQVKSLQVV